MNRLQTTLLLFTLTALAVAMAPPPRAAAQAPDVRDVRPMVMLLVDSSGSMERMGSCECSTPTCEECYPRCIGTSGDDRNRWGTVVEAMTGSFSTYDCEVEDRSDFAYRRESDYRYYIPHFLHPNEARITGGAHRPDITQLENGVLDAYLERIKFGLMTFDGVGTLRDEPFLVPERIFDTPGFLSDSIDYLGGYSYGEPQPFSFPGCGEPYMIDNGAQRDYAAGGTLVSVGSDAVDDYVNINQRIQETLLRIRPFGPTPTAGLLEDFEFYLGNHPDVAPITTVGGAGDAFAECRQRYAILLTDGYPNSDMRGEPYRCDTPGSDCPYDRPTETAARLCDFNPATGACDGDIDGLYVVGFDIADAQAISELNMLAESGGTCATSGGDCAFLVDSDPSTDDVATLRAAIADILDRAAPGTTTRTTPAFSGATPGSTQQGQAQFNTGFQIPGAERDGPWYGVLERRRFECDGALEPVEQPIDDQDRFGELLNDQTSRTILTVLPSNPRNVGGHLVGEDSGLSSVGGVSGGRPCRGGGPGGVTCDASGRPTGRRQTTRPGRGGGGPLETGLRLTDLSNATRRHFDVTSNSIADEIIDWVYGETREQDLGDIYHSSPVVVGPPTEDMPDESFNAFRRRPEVANRPKVVYVGTNDGLMHAFVAEDIDIVAGPHAGESYTAGHELWAFAPPALLPKMNSARDSHQFMVDGTPVVKDVFFRRLPGQGPDGSIYHTVLLFGLRGGGSAYLALDVTDPLEPEFLWQMAHEEMGNTYGVPGLGQVLVRDSSGQLQEIALAMLPGGTGTDLSSETCGGVPEPLPDGTMSKPIGCPSRGKGRPPVNEGTLTARENQRCWGDTGRALFFVDPATGEVVSHLDDRVFNAPLTGGVSFFTGDVGTVATRAFLTDADGVIWRIDISNPDMREWDADPFHDIFWDGDATDGQPAFYPPILTTNQQGEVVVIQATGNTDVLDGLAYNKVVSVTENLTFEADGDVDDLEGVLNWEIRLEDGEQVTGPLELFNGKVYFASFRTTNDPTNACAYGESRIWGVEYLLAEDGPGSLPVGGLEFPEDSGTFVRSLPPLTNQIVQGVAVTQRPTCSQLAEVSETDPYLGSRQFYRVQDSRIGSYQLVAQISGGGEARAGGSVAEFTRELPPPLAYTRVQSWAGSID